MTKLLETLSRATPVITGLLWSDKEYPGEVTREEISELFATDLQDAERAAHSDTSEV